MMSPDPAARLLQKLSPLSDEQWLELLIRSIKDPSLEDVALPGFPPDSVQRNIVGSAGEHTLREAYKFYLEIKDYAGRLGKVLTPDGKIVDFGCGWGRIIRFFLKEVKADNLYGVDVDPELIAYCRQLFPYAHFRVGTPLPPAEFADESIDIIYAYSVFSHLSEPVHLRWLEEFSRILKPGGLLFATTQPREFIEFCRSLRGKTHESSWHNTLACSFPDADAALADYDSGAFVFCATGGGPALPNTFYGETLIPRGYVERQWTKHFIFRDFMDDRNRQPQALIVMQKPDNTLPEYTDRLKAVLDDKDVLIRHLAERLAGLEARIASLENREQRIVEIESMLRESESAFNTYKSVKEQHIVELESMLDENRSALDRIHGSRGWKVLTAYYKMRDLILRR